MGQLYGQDDPRRDSGFTIFYMGINLGAFLSPLIAGTLGQKVGWHWGFGSAAVGMILGLIFYQIPATQVPCWCRTLAQGHRKRTRKRSRGGIEG